MKLVLVLFQMNPDVKYKFKNKNKNSKIFRSKAHKKILTKINLNKKKKSITF